MLKSLFCKMKQKLQLLTGYVEIFLICGLVYSWAVFDHILRKEGVYEELCETSTSGNETCPAQDKIFVRPVFFASVFFNDLCSCR